jgi:hypothetical protein
MFTTRFWQSTIERAVKSFAQALAALIGAGGIGIVNAPWISLLSTAGMAALLSVLTSIASEHVGPPNDPSVVSPPQPPVASALPAPQPAP